MDLRKLKTILELFEESGVAEMELTEGEDRVRLCKHIAPPAPQPVAAPPPSVAAAPAAAVADSSAAAATTPAESPPDGKQVVAPMVGTFYRASSPEIPPFVRVGQTVEAGQTLCIIEAMKLMNEIPSPTAGKITHILAENGAPVGYGEPLFVIS